MRDGPVGHAVAASQVGAEIHDDASAGGGEEPSGLRSALAGLQISRHGIEIISRESAIAPFPSQRKP
jgi:hypothetical protein